jgi:hypothetical protein
MPDRMNACLASLAPTSWWGEEHNNGDNLEKPWDPKLCRGDLR